MPRIESALQINGSAVKALREAHGWRSSKFATACEISHGYLSNIESGRRSVVGPDVLRRIADVLGVPLAAITSHRSIDEVA